MNSILSLFNIPWILKLGSVVGKNNGEVFLEGTYANGVTKVIDGIHNALLGTVWKQYYYHEAAVSKE